MSKSAALAAATREALKLDNQLCFPLYAASRLVIRLYHPLLEPLGLTYLQYIVLMILWEHGAMTVGEIGAEAMLDTGTLSPLLKRLAQQGLVLRTRGGADERVVKISVTKAGQALKERCLAIPAALFNQVGFPLEDALALKGQIEKLLACLTKADTAA